MEVCLNTIFKIWPDKNFVQGEKNAGSKGHKGSLKINRYPAYFIGSADGIIASTAHGVEGKFQVFSS